MHFENLIFEKNGNDILNSINEKIENISNKITSNRGDLVINSGINGMFPFFIGKVNNKIIVFPKDENIKDLPKHITIDNSDEEISQIFPKEKRFLIKIKNAFENHQGIFWDNLMFLCDLLYISKQEEDTTLSFKSNILNYKINNNHSSYKKIKDSILGFVVKSAYTQDDKSKVYKLPKETEFNYVNDFIQNIERTKEIFAISVPIILSTKSLSGISEGVLRSLSKLPKIEKLPILTNKIKKFFTSYVDWLINNNLDVDSSLMNYGFFETFLMSVYDKYVANAVTTDVKEKRMEEQNEILRETKKYFNKVMPVYRKTIVNKLKILDWFENISNFLEEKNISWKSNSNIDLTNVQNKENFKDFFNGSKTIKVAEEGYNINLNNNQIKIVDREVFEKLAFISNHQTINQLSEQTTITNFDKNKRKIGLYAMSGKPVTKGHFQVIEKMSKECDQNIVMVSTADRNRRNELPVSGESMLMIWNKFLINKLPHNVKVELDNSSPIKRIHELLENHLDNKHFGNVMFVLYGDELTLLNIWNDEKLLKYHKELVNNGLIDNVQGKLIRGEKTVLISATEMRKFLNDGDQYSFFENLPQQLNIEEKKEIWNILKPNNQSITENTFVTPFVMM